MHELRLHQRIVYDVKANWKLIVLNYNECLHCPVLHPALNRLTDYLGAENAAPTPDYVGRRHGISRRRRNHEHGRHPPPRLPARPERGRAKMVCYYAIYPNLLLSLHPDYMMTHTLWPRAVDRTEVICEWHFHPEEMARPDFVAGDAVEFWDVTNREDWHIAELSQAGIRSRAYSPARIRRGKSCCALSTKSSMEPTP